MTEIGLEDNNWDRLRTANSSQIYRNYDTVPPSAEVPTRFGIKPALYSDTSVEAVVASIKDNTLVYRGYPNSKIGKSRYQR